jgi:hypothetical protein
MTIILLGIANYVCKKKIFSVQTCLKAENEFFNNKLSSAFKCSN